MFIEKNYDPFYVHRDINADFFRSKFRQYATDFCDNHNLSCFNYKILNVHTFAYTNNAGLYCKLLDLVISTIKNFTNINMIQI